MQKIELLFYTEKDSIQNTRTETNKPTDKHILMSHSGRLIVPVKITIAVKPPSDTENAQRIIKKNKTKYFNSCSKALPVFMGYGRAGALWSGNRSYTIQY